MTTPTCARTPLLARLQPHGRVLFPAAPGRTAALARPQSSPLPVRPLDDAVVRYRNLSSRLPEQERELRLVAYTIPVAVCVYLYVLLTYSSRDRRQKTALGGRRRAVPALENARKRRKSVCSRLAGASTTGGRIARHRAW